MTAPLIVGEAPSRAGHTNFHEDSRSGGKLAQLGAVELERVNLLPQWPGSDGKGSAFPVRTARLYAELLLDRTRADVPLILMGTRVAKAFRLRREDYDFLRWQEWTPPGRRKPRLVAVCPHPSGINMWWNDHWNQVAAADFFRELLGGAR